jgi:hypothetical protein
LYRLYINDAPVAPVTHLALFMDDACIYVTEKHECHVLRKLQCSLTEVKSWCEHWNLKINEGKTVTENSILVTVLGYMVECYAKYSADLKIKIHFKYSHLHTYKSLHIKMSKHFTHVSYTDYIISSYIKLINFHLYFSIHLLRQ